MKKTILLLIFLPGIFVRLSAQNTNYGVGSGTGGAAAYNSFFGYNAGAAQTSLSTATYNSMFGGNSGLVLTTGSWNSGFGYGTLQATTTGATNTAVGYAAMVSNTTGGANVAIGYGSLPHNTTGSYNTASGQWALYSNTTGTNNTAAGYEALKNATSADNTAIGYQALIGNVSGQQNTAVGSGALYSSKDAQNTAVGYQTLYNATTGGSGNTGIGAYTLGSVTTGYENVGVGYSVGGSLTTGWGNVAVGGYCGPTVATVTNSIAIGYGVNVAASYSAVIGNTSMVSIGGYQGWSNLSDGRFKINIKEDVSGLAFINQLRPVSYVFDADAFNSFSGLAEKAKKELNAAKLAPARRTGFIAQEVEAAAKKIGMTFSGVVTPQNDKDHYRLVYADFVVPLVKAVQELNTQVTGQQKKMDSLVSIISALTKGQLLAAPLTTPSAGSQLMLNQNFPNPFSANTQITMTLPETAQQASIIVYNLQGTQLKTIPVSSRGNASITISGGELGAGMYLYSLIVDGKIVDTKRMILTN